MSLNKNEFNKLMNVFNRAYRQIGRRKPKKKRRFNKNKTNQEKTRPQHYGVGRTFATIDTTIYVTAEQGELGAVNIINNAVTSAEFARYKLDYLYFKILNIKITLATNMIGSGSNGFNFLKMNWDSAPTTEQPRIQEDDNAKMFPNYRTRDIVFTFIPPNAVINFDSYAYNYFNFMLTRDSTNLRSTLWYTKSVPYEMKVSVNMLFAGAQTRSIATRIKELYKYLSLEEKNDIKLYIKEESVVEKEEDKNSKI